MIHARLGLDGRAFVLQILGFGCNVPAIHGTRVIAIVRRGCSHAGDSFSLLPAAWRCLYLSSRGAFFARRGGPVRHE